MYGLCLLVPYPSTYPHIHISSTHSYTLTLSHSYALYSATYIIKNWQQTLIGLEEDSVLSEDRLEYIIGSVSNVDRMKKLAAHFLENMIQQKHEFPKNAERCLRVDGVTSGRQKSFYSALLNIFAVRQHVVGWVTAGSDKASALIVIRNLDLKGKPYLMYDQKQQALYKIWQELKLFKATWTQDGLDRVFLQVRLILNGRPDSGLTDQEGNTVVVCVPANTKLGIRFQPNEEEQAVVVNIVRYNNFRLFPLPTAI